jgi:hypothetical protein
VEHHDTNHIAPYDGLFHFVNLIGVMGCHLLDDARICFSANNNSIQFNMYLLTCRLNSTSANYKVSTLINTH